MNRGTERVGYDCNGISIFVGDFIHFIFRTQSPFGELTDDVQGRILKVNGHLCFRYKKENGKFSTLRLSALNYDSTTDWEYGREFSYHVNVFKERVVHI